MENRRDYWRAILLPALMLSFSGCSRETPTSPTDVGARAHPTFLSAQESETPADVVAFILPEATGTVVNAPEFGRVSRAPVGNSLQSLYFRTAEDNRQFRRGIAEFKIPDLRGMVSASILLHHTGSYGSDPVPPDRHELSAYSDVDFAVNPSDFDRRTMPVGTFETDGNLSHQTSVLDVSRFIGQSRGGGLGFRVQLEVDPTYTAMGSFGMGWHSSNPFILIEVTTTPAEANGLLMVLIRKLALPSHAWEASLLGPLSRVAEILADHDRGNDRTACGELRTFIARAEALGAAPDSRDPYQHQSLLLSERALDIAGSLDCSGPRLGRGRLSGPTGVAER